MENAFKFPAWLAVAFVGCLAVSGCSTVSGVASKLNPFSSSKAGASPEVTPAKSTIRVEAPNAPATVVAGVPAAPTGAVAVKVGDNDKCTTFCALPVRKHPAP